MLTVSTKRTFLLSKGTLFNDIAESFQKPFSSLKALKTLLSTLTAEISANKSS